MKNLTAIALFVAAGFVTAGSALAQDHKVTATVPFNFTVDGRTLPAGNYTIGNDANSPRILTIADRKDGVAVMAITIPDSGYAADNKLVFHRYGNQYFLSEVRTTSGVMTCHLTASKQEKWARAQTQEASLRVNNDVLIALK
ncbi:hypothetical protein [Tunturiibacter gelidoferens]|jgi:hypothetical protein|uniref:Uncharacterized protein n=1 Tax=Tunturiibacter gelidiferens TaxID=3069689 RepID=A0A9X0U6U2_9BACT|nr:hypothetical protein [Edaphobacter lichenicola]MBB5330187.1 hypothetical protein [Edaphobacter lichenicola]